MDGDGDGVLRLRIGRAVTFGRRCVLEIWGNGSNALELGDHTIVDDDVTLRLYGGAIRVGTHCQLRDHVRCKSYGELVLGHKAILGAFGIVHCSERIELHDYVGLAERTTVIDSDHGFDGSDEYFMDAPIKTAPIVLERNCFCGTGTTILRGARIGRNSVVGAGAVLPRGEYPAGWLITGSPAAPRKPLPAAVAAELQVANGSPVSSSL